MIVIISEKILYIVNPIEKIAYKFHCITQLYSRFFVSYDKNYFKININPFR